MRIVKGIVAFALMAGFIFLALKVGGWTVGVFGNASDTVKAASIAALVSVLTFLAGRYFEQERERKARANVEKIQVYEKFFEFYFKVMGNSDYVEKPEDDDWIAKFLIEFQRELLLWGSDRVLKAYIAFKKSLEGSAQLAEQEEDLPKQLAPTIRSAAKLLKCMRQDIGYPRPTSNPCPP